MINTKHAKSAKKESSCLPHESPLCDFVSFVIFVFNSPVFIGQPIIMLNYADGRGQVCTKWNIDAESVKTLTKSHPLSPKKVQNLFQLRKSG